MPTFTYWRMQTVPNTASSIYVQLSEVTYLDAAGTDLSVGGIATSSSQFDATYSAAQAFDKSFATKDWASFGTDTQPWLQYQHTAPVNVARVAVRFSATSNYLPSAFWFQASNSGAAPWSNFYPAGGGKGAGATYVYDLVPDLVGLPVGPIAPNAFTPDYVSLANPRVLDLKFSGDRIHGGPGRIYGSVFRKGTPADFPAVARVRLHRDVDGLCIRETWSNAAGAYEFPDLSLDYKYTAIARDHTHDYRAVIADNLTPEVPA